MTTPATRADVDAAEQRVTDKIGKAHDRINVVADKVTVIETKSEGWEEKMSANAEANKELGGEVKALGSSLTQATGTFNAGMVKMGRHFTKEEDRETAEEERLAQEKRDKSNYWKRWRSAATPQNAVALVMILSVLGALFKGNADQAQVLEALEEASRISAGIPPAPVVEPAPVKAPESVPAAEPSP